MAEIINAAPRAILRGVQDLSGRAPVYEPEALPQHLPHVFLYTERGTGVPQITIGDGLNKLYGANSFDLRKKVGEGGYATHQTLLATVLSQNANQMLVQRIIPMDAKTARMRVYLDILEEAAYVYARNADGSVQRYEETDTLNVPPQHYAGDPIVPAHNARGTWDMTVAGDSMPFIPTQVAASAPIDDSAGEFYLNSTSNNIFGWDGSSWALVGKAGSGTNGAIAIGDTWTITNVDNSITYITTGTNARAVSLSPAVNSLNGWLANDADLIVKSLMWVVEAVPEDNTHNTTFGSATIRNPGYRAGSIAYPIMEFEAASAGAWGNNLGIRFSAPNSSSSIPFDTRLVKEQLTTMYRMTIVEKQNPTTAPVVIENRYSEQFIDFSLKPTAVDDRMGKEIYLPKTYKEMYIDNSTFPPSYKAFSDLHLYDDNIAQVLQELYMHERQTLKKELGWDITDIDAILPNDNGQAMATQVATGNVALTGTHPLTGSGLNLTGALGDGSVVIYLGDQTQATQNGYYAYNVASGNYTLTPVEADGKFTVNFFTAVGWNAYPYESIRMANTTNPVNAVATNMTSTTTQYALGGSNGTMSLEAFELAVAEQCENYGDMIVKRNPMGDADPSDVPLDFMDTAKWPQSVIWDTGFGLGVEIPGSSPLAMKNVKASLLVPMGRRKDIWVALSTQEIGPGRILNTPSEESSVAITLQNAARMYPESEYYGTKTCRAIVLGHAGELLSSTWRGLAPMTIDLAAKVASYMGASNGAWIPGKNFDISPKNQVTMFKTNTVNATFKTADVRNEDWANGLIWVQNYDRRSLFYPGIQTVYDDDTSVLNSLFNIIAVVELEKVCDRTWRDLTGIQTLTVAQFIERSDRLIASKVANRFDDKFIIVPETYLTEGDEQRGYSWSCKVNLYAANMRTVGTYTIVSRRIEDYQQ